jgi:hypothetical protein
MPARVQGSTKGGLSLLLFVTRAGDVFAAYSNDGTAMTGQQFAEHMKRFEAAVDGDERLGELAGLVLVLDNSAPHHKALAALYHKVRYWPATAEGEAAPYVPARDMPTTERAQYLVMREGGIGPDGRRRLPRYILFTPAGMAMMQPFESLFSALKERLARVPPEANPTSTARVAAEAIKYELRQTPKDSVRGCVQAAKHFRDAWKARQAEVDAGKVERLRLEDVERAVRDASLEQHREANALQPYATEAATLRGMVERLPPGVKVVWRRVARPEPLDETPDDDVVLREPPGDVDQGSFVFVPQVSVEAVKATERGQAEWDQKPHEYWHNLPKPRSATQAALRHQNDVLAAHAGEVYSARALDEERQARRQARRMRTALKRSGAAPRRKHTKKRRAADSENRENVECDG